MWAEGGVGTTHTDVTGCHAMMQEATGGGYGLVELSDTCLKVVERH